jgi:hypothetical protein
MEPHSEPYFITSSRHSLATPCEGDTSTCYFTETIVDTARVAYKHITRMLKAHFTDHHLVMANQSQLKAIMMTQAQEQVPVRITNVGLQAPPGATMYQYVGSSCSLTLPWVKMNSEPKYTHFTRPLLANNGLMSTCSPMSVKEMFYYITEL